MEEKILLLFLVLFPMAGALITGLTVLGKKGKGDGTAKRGGILAGDIVTIVTAAVEWIAAVFSLKIHAGGEAPVFSLSSFCGIGLSLTVDGFRQVQIILASFAFLAAALFSLDYMKKEKNRIRFQAATLLTLGAVMGIFLSADLFTTFLFFEIMSFTSYVWVAQEETQKALRAAGTYLAIAVLGGLVMLMGLFLLYHTAGTLNMEALLPASREAADKMYLYIAGFCILFGFGAKAGIFGLHVWMPSSYDQAPAPASALLSGILSKTGVFGIIVISANLFTRDIPWGMTVLILGILTMAGGAVLALFSVNLKRILAYSSMSQIGFMLIGIGMYCLMEEGRELAVHGTILHMINHSVIKLVLFMAAGVIFMNLGKLDINEIRGFGRKKPALNLVFLMGALGIGGIPLFNGYVSKTLLHESIQDFMRNGVGNTVFMHATEWLFLLSGGLTVAYMAKLYVAVFIEKNESSSIQESYDAMKGSYMSRLSGVLLTACSLLIPLLGSLPRVVADHIADMSEDIMYEGKMEEAVNYFSLESLKGGAISILTGLLVYLVVVRLCLMRREEGKSVKSYADYWPKWINLEETLYRPMMLKVLPGIGLFFARIGDTFVDGIVVFLRRTLYRDKRLDVDLEEGTPMTHALGTVMDGLYRLFHPKSDLHGTPASSYVHKLAVIHEELTENNRIIGRSLSFGLLLFCVGFILTVVYLFWL